ncbi:MAG: hypothetical protein ACOC1P_03270 [Minisyncoccales bacterium]
MSAVYLALLELMYDPKLEIYGNVKINHPRAHNTPFLFLPFEKIYNAILIIDDASKIENIRRYAKVVSNITRKLKLDILFTGQDEKHVPKRIRGQLNYKIRPFLDKNKDILSVKILYEDGKVKWYNFTNAIERNKKYDIYDTQEIPPFILKTDAIREIAKISSTPYEIERNLMLFSGDKKEHKQMKKEILNHSKYNGKKKSIVDSKKGIARTKEDLIKDFKFMGFTNREINKVLGIGISAPSKLKKQVANAYFEDFKTNEEIPEDKRLWALNKLIEECNLKRILPSNL